MKSEEDVYSIRDLEKDGVTCWEGVRNYEARNLMRDRMREGDEVLIEDGLVNNGNIDLSSDARILTRRNMLIGEVTRFEYDDNSLFVTVGGKDLALDRKNALRFMKVEVADDISLSTVATLKKDKLLNNRIAVRIEDGQVKG